MLITPWETARLVGGVVLSLLFNWKLGLKVGPAVKESPSGPGHVDARATCQALDSLVRPRGRRRIGGDAAPDVDSTKRKSRRASILGGKFWISPGRDVL